MINEKYSYKDFTDKTFLDVPVKEFNNTVIVGSCFSQQNEPNKKVFPRSLKDVVFRKCNLDNVYIPSGNKIEDGCYRRLITQNDLETWIVDKSNKPIKPVHNKDEQNTDPEKIPDKCMRTEVIIKSEWNDNYGKGVIPEKSWFKEIPKIIKTETKEVFSTVNGDVYAPDVKKGKYMHYDSIPIELGREKVTKKILRKDDNGKLILTAKFRPIIEGTKEVDVVKLKGQVTYYTVEGEQYKYRGEK